MLYKKLTRHDGDVIFVNIGQSLTFRRDGGRDDHRLSRSR